jgi:hypothetical protein
MDWELFGVNEDSTVLDLKRSFFNIALITHPDKNHGVTNEEFIYVLSEYKNIKFYLEKKEKCNDVTKISDLSVLKINETKEEDLTASKIPSFMSIYEEVHDNYKNFNKLFEENKNKNINLENDDKFCFLSSQDSGYKVEPSEYTSLEDLKYNPNILKTDQKEKSINDKKRTDIIKLEDLYSVSQINNSAASINFNGSLSIVDNFTTEKYVDYGDAFLQPSFLLDTIPIETLDHFKSKEHCCLKNINIDYLPLEYNNSLNNLNNLNNHATNLNSLKIQPEHEHEHEHEQPEQPEQPEHEQQQHEQPEQPEPGRWGPGHPWWDGA